jgi:hypothetical protein
VDRVRDGAGSDAPSKSSLAGGSDLNFYLASKSRKIPYAQRQGRGSIGNL